MAGKWVFIDLDNQFDRKLLQGTGDGKTLFECEITFLVNNAGEFETTDSWFDALKSDDLKLPTIKFDDSAGSVSIHFAEIVARPASLFFSSERIVLEALSRHADINSPQDNIIKHGRIRLIPRSHL
jgi:hypothetical protein